MTALKTLRADGCPKLRELPVEFGMLTNLSALNIEKCKALGAEELKSPQPSLKKSLATCCASRHFRPIRIDSYSDMAALRPSAVGKLLAKS